MIGKMNLLVIALATVCVVSRGQLSTLSDMKKLMASYEGTYQRRDAGKDGRFDTCFDELPSEFRCFNNRSPYTNTNFKKPQSPTQQQIEFKLFTKSNPITAQILTADTKPANFVSTGKVACIIHGYTGSSATPWIQDLKTELLKRTEITNVILVDWATGAKSPKYWQAAANARVVGALLATLLERLEVDPAHVHLVGHSLGAHVAGYAGEKFGALYPTFHDVPLGRITGLDPARPAFEEHDIRVRLDPTDATFVDVIHTDKGVLGMTKLCGDVDFMPNGGKDMPECTENDPKFENLETIDGVRACSHNQAPLYFVASIHDNDFPACPCSESAVDLGTCNIECTDAQSNHMGYHATKSPGGLFYLTTG